MKINIGDIFCNFKANIENNIIFVTDYKNQKYYFYYIDDPSEEYFYSEDMAQHYWIKL